MKKQLAAIILILVLTCSCVICPTASALEVGGVDIHGFVSQGFLMSDHYNYLPNDSKKGSFQYNELGVNFGKELNEKTRVGLQLFSRDLGDVGKNKVSVDWAFGDYRPRDWLGFRVGKIKLPLGFYNETRDIDLLRTNIIMPQSLYPDLLRDTVIATNGAGVYGNIDLSMAGSLDYLGVAGRLSIDNDSGFEKYFNSQAENNFEVNGNSESNITVAGSLRWNTPQQGLILGVSGLQSKIDTPVRIIKAGDAEGTSTSENTFFTLSAEFTWEDLVIAAEYQTYDMEYVTIMTSGNAQVADDLIPAEGYYISASYRFTELFSMGAYYSVFYSDTDDKSGDDRLYASDSWEKDFALSLRFDITESLMFKLEGHYVDGTARILRQDSSDRTRDDFGYGVAKVSFSF